MCLLKIKSTNPKFSFIIYKNPNSGMQIKDIRQGFGYGFFPKESENTYIIFFRDGANEMSYKEYPGQQYEYLNRLRYTSPIFVLNAISEFLHSATKERSVNDEVNKFIHKISYVTNIDNQTFKMIERVNRFFPDFKISIDKKAEVTYKINIETIKSLYHLLNFSVMYFSIIAMLGEYDIDLNEGLIDKLIRCLNVCDAEYYIRYIVSSRVLTSKKLYEKYKGSLERDGMKLLFGNTAVHRREFIKGLVSFDKSIIDIGCGGQGSYCIPFSQKIAEMKYYAIDTDENELDILRKKVSSKELSNVVILNSHKLLLNEISNECKYDVIITEVVEHIERNESQEMIRWVINNINFDKIIVTTPNRSFNKYYMLDDNTFRHDDHKWEYTEDEFKVYISEINLEQFKITYLDIGDTVNEISCSQGVLIQKIYKD